MTYGFPKESQIRIGMGTNKRVGEKRRGKIEMETQRRMEQEGYPSLGKAKMIVS